jgi:enoyl-CoA hydratase/carnithine racemase
MKNSPTVLAQQEGAVLVLTLNRPEKANAMNEEMHGALVSRLESAAGDAGVRAVLLSASGTRVFSAGADLKEFAELERGVGARKRRALLMRTLHAALDFPKPLLAAVQGKALGAGCMLALLADEVILADTAELGMPEIRHGIPTPIGIVILAERGGMSVARQMVQSGAPIDARQAHATGLADGLVNFSSLSVNAMERAKALAALSGPSFEANKKFMNAGLRAALRAAAVQADRL